MNCGARFHAECVSDWWLQKGTLVCPLCREVVQPAEESRRPSTAGTSPHPAVPVPAVPAGAPRRDAGDAADFDL